jgi:hypothetical protein
MFARVLTVLAVMSVVVLTMVAPAHAAGMSAGSSHALHGSETMHVAPCGEHASPEHHGCGDADDVTCEFICTGLTASLAIPIAETGQAYVSRKLPFPSELSMASQSPDLNERPPKTCLL